MFDTRPNKRVSESKTLHTEIVMSSHVNGAGRLFGGLLMQWIDVVAAVVARRHSQMDVITASISSLEFKAPAHLNDTIELVGQIVYAGRTSMEVRVDTYVESLSRRRTHVNRAYLTMVALDENGRPAPVPALIPETTEDKEEYHAAEARRNARKKETNV